MKATKQVSPDVGKRISSAAVGLAALFVLAACGGGGGSSTAAPPPGTGGGTPPAPAPAPNPAPPPAPAPSGSLSTAPCVIPAGSTSCPLTIRYTLKDGVNATVVVDGLPAIPVTNGTDVTVAATLTREGNRNVTLRNGDGKVIATGTVGANCVTDAKWDEAVDKACRVPSYFDELTFGIWGPNSHFYLVSKTAPMQPLINKTRWNLDLTGDFLYTGGFAKVRLDEQCRFLVTMFDQGERKARDLYIDPPTRELHERSSQIPDANNDYVFAEPFDPAYPDWYTKAFVQGGVFYSTATGGGDPTAYREHLFYKPDGGAEKLIQSWTVQDGNLKMMATVRCPKQP